MGAGRLLGLNTLTVADSISASSRHLFAAAFGKVDFERYGDFATVMALGDQCPVFVEDSRIIMPSGLTPPGGKLG